MCCRPNFSTEAWWVVCLIDEVYNSFFTLYSSESYWFNLWIFRFLSFGRPIVFLFCPLLLVWSQRWHRKIVPFTRTLCNESGYFIANLIRICRYGFLKYVSETPVSRTWPVFSWNHGWRLGDIEEVKKCPHSSRVYTAGLPYDPHCMAMWRCHLQLLMGMRWCSHVRVATTVNTKKQNNWGLLIIHHKIGLRRSLLVVLNGL